MEKGIETKRLTLRPVQLGDEKEIHEYNAKALMLNQIAYRQVTY